MISSFVRLPTLSFYVVVYIVIAACLPACASSPQQQQISEPIIEDISMPPVNAKWKFSDTASPDAALDSDTRSPRAVAMVVHGLNLRPSAMDSVTDLLLENGVDVLQVILSGHDMEGLTDAKRLTEFQSVNYQRWRAEMLQAHDMLTDRSNQLDIPKYLVAYSIGALLGVDILLPEGEKTVQGAHRAYDKMVLLAPAVAIRPVSHFLKPLSWWPALVMPSFSPRDYHANWGTPMAAYNALYDILQHFEAEVSSEINFPSLVVVDKNDELVSPSGMRDLVNKHKLSGWGFYYVEKDSNAQTWYHHLILDEWSLGKSSWTGMRTEIEAFLEDSRQ